MIAGNFRDELRLREPLRVGADFVLGHSGEGVHFDGEVAHDGNFRDEMDEGKKGSAPRLDEHDPAFFAQYALHFGEGLIEVAGQIRKMMQAALDNQHVFAAIGKGELAAIGHGAFGGAPELGNEARREVHALHPRETQALQSDQAVTAAAKKLDNFRVARPFACPKAVEAPDKLAYFLFRRFKAEIRGFPRVGS